MQAAFFDVLLERGDLVQRLAGDEFVITPHEIVGNGHRLAELVGGGFVDADVVAVGFGHFAHAVQTFQQRHGQDALRLEVVLAHEGAPDQQVEGLVGAAHFDVGLERHGVIPLHEGIEELVQGDGRIFAVTLGEVVALHHAGQRVARAQADEVGSGEVVEPAGVEFHYRLFGIEDFEDLFLIGFGVGDDLFGGQRRTGGGTAGGVPDAAGEVADEEDDPVAQFLKMAELVDEDGVAQMEIRRGGVETGLDGKGLAPFQLFAQFAFINQIGDAAFDQLHLFIDRNHQNLLSLPVREDSPAGGGNA
jgi:hypothetical protein